MLRPGRLTADRLPGRRKPCIPPLQLFLVANVSFSLLHPLIGSNTLTTSHNTRLHHTWHRHIALLLSPQAYRFALFFITFWST